MSITTNNQFGGLDSNPGRLDTIKRLALIDGWRLFPLSPQAKTPAVSDWPNVATSDQARLEKWQRDLPACNWGMATGIGSGVFVIDLDGEAGSAWFAEQLRVRGNAWAETRKAKTARGLHLFFAWPGNGISLRNSAGKIAAGVDLRAEGGYVVIPPSVHPEGSSYEWLTAPAQAVLSAPAWLLALATWDTQQPGTAPGADDITGVIPEGQRNLTLTSLAGSMRKRGMTQEAIEAALLVENRRCSPPLAEAEVKTIAASVASYPPEPKPLTEVQLIRMEGGAPRACTANVVALLRHSPEWSGVIGFDEFSERVVLRKAGPGFPSDTRPFPRRWTDEADIYAQEWLQRAGILVNSTNVVASAVQAVAREEKNRFHPVRDWLSNLVWDGVERADHWLEICFGAKTSDYVSAISRRWLIGACARIFLPGCQVDHTLLLLGQQGVGKSSGLRALVPNPDWFADSISTLASRDSRQELRGKWIVELAELSALRRAEIEAVKSFLSERVDHYRPPYGRHAIDVSRQCVFAGSTNEETPLLDVENRRFWPVRVGKVDVMAMEQYRDQLWAEAVSYFKQGDPWWLEEEELQRSAVQEQKQAYQPGPWDERITEWIEKPKPRSAFDEVLPWADSERGKINIDDVLTHCVGLEFCRFQDRDRRSVGRCLRHLGYRVMQEGSGKNRGKRYYVKEETE